MNSDDQLDHEIEAGLRRMSKMQKATLYVELLFRLAVFNFIRWWKYSKPRSRVHWLGHQHRPRRLERPLLLTIITIAPLVLEIDQYLLWLSLWGGGVAVVIPLYAAYRQVPQKRYHWAGR